MKKITILALHLSTGGVEKSIATLSNILAKRYEVEIIVNYQMEDKPAFYIDEKVKIRYLMPQGLKPNEKEFKMALKQFRLIRVLKEGIKAVKILYLRKVSMIKQIRNLSCDIAISTRYLYNKMLGKYAKKEIITIAQEHNNNGNKTYVKKVIKSLEHIDYFMPVSKQLTKLYEEKLVGTKTKCIYIPHCLKTYPYITSTLEEKIILCAGRLSEEKGLLDLVDVFEMVNRKNPDWHLKIVGDGKQKQEIQKKIIQKGLETKISLLGFQKEEELNNLFLQASIYVMTSFHESFGLVLIEAESFGIPLLAFDSAEGPKEIIKNGQNGFLISNRNKEQMAEKICELIVSEDKRKKMGQVARQMSMQYKMEHVEKMWYKLVEETFYL